MNINCNCPIPNTANHCDMFNRSGELLQTGVSIAITSVTPDTTEKVWTITFDVFQYMILSGAYDKPIKMINRLKKNKRKLCTIMITSKRGAYI